MNPANNLSEVALSNLFTMGATQKVDPRQKLPAGYEVPPEETRILRAKLLMEECLETIQGLGLRAYNAYPGYVNKEDLEYIPYNRPYCTGSLEGIIDGCCDLIYVATGTLLACGAPDLPHLLAVCEANNAKFPGGVATVNADGKYQKPEGWQAPDHAAVQKRVEQQWRELESFRPTEDINQEPRE